MSRPQRKPDLSPTAERSGQYTHEIRRKTVLSDEAAARFEHRLANPKEPTQALRDLMRMKD